jgi:alanine-glyoxylate transaminase/(R)-3-amino-2-methylpropionate-pyruvate transaminase
MPLCGVGNWKFSFPSSFGIHHTTNPDPYGGRIGGSFCRDSLIQTTRKCDCISGQCLACDAYIEDLQILFNTTLPKRIAGFFAESIQGVGGVVQYPKDFLKRAFDLGLYEKSNCYCFVVLSLNIFDI